jgi:hypothetical protein
MLNQFNQIHHLAVICYSNNSIRQSTGHSSTPPLRVPFFPIPSKSKNTLLNNRQHGNAINQLEIFSPTDRIATSRAVRCIITFNCPRGQCDSPVLSKDGAGPSIPPRSAHYAVKLHWFYSKLDSEGPHSIKVVTISTDIQSSGYSNEESHKSHLSFHSLSRSVPSRIKA